MLIRKTFLCGSRHGDRSQASTPPFPAQQLFVLAVCRICEPIAFMSIFPYVYYMVQSFHVTSDPNRIAIYVGMITSSFAFAEFSSAIVWGRISDRIGRKPVLLMGLAGTAASVVVLGFAPSLPVALLARALGGLLNGNMGVLQTTVAELVKVKEHQPRAYSIMPFVWCLGSILGPAMGGTLAQPCDNYPAFFPRGSIFDRNPFLLPNLICAAILVIGVTIGILFLEETLEEKRDRRDPGLELGRTLIRRFSPCIRSSQHQSEKHCAEEQHYARVQAENDEEPPPSYSPLHLEAELPEYCTKDSTPRSSVGEAVVDEAATVMEDAEMTPHSAKSGPKAANKAFTRQVVLVIAAFGILAYHSISFDQLMPVFLSEPVSHDPIHLPFLFSGGFGYSTKKIGFMLSVQGVYSMIAQLFIFPFCARRFGTLNTFRSVILIWPFLYLLVPYLVLLPHTLRQPAVYLALLTKITFHVLAFPSTAILLANAAPSKRVLGLVNGASASTASLARACGPTITGLVHAWGLKLGSTGTAWWACGLICLIGAIESWWLQDSDGTSDSGAEGDSDCEEALSESNIPLLPADAEKTEKTQSEVRHYEVDEKADA